MSFRQQPGLSALFRAIDEHDDQLVGRLLEAGADCDARSSVPPLWTPLGAAIEELECGGSISTIRRLLEAGASVNAVYIGDTLTPLHAALHTENQSVVELLLDWGADPCAVSEEDQSPLLFAVEQRLHGIAELLLEYGAERTIDLTGGFTAHTALATAARNADAAMVRLLLQAGADLSATDSDGYTAVDHLHTAQRLSDAAFRAVSDLLSDRERVAPGTPKIDPGHKVGG
ncbi:MAG: uncharacterized protein JWR01_765 [Subtercola sp.]|nr:uncharacterized protein [Subtercola sp.]